MWVWLSLTKGDVLRCHFLHFGRLKPLRLAKDLPLRYKHLLHQGSQLLNRIPMNTESSTPGSEDNAFGRISIARVRMWSRYI